MIKLIKKTKLFYIFIFLSILVFITYRKSLSLSLYGDDWLVIAKYWAGNGSTSGYGYAYWDPRLYISNYGFQNFTALLYKLITTDPLIYFVLSLLLRALSALGVFIFANKVIGRKIAFLSASFYATSVVGAETTDWVYNMNTYLGIFVALVGLSFLILRKSAKDLILGIILSILGYGIVPIRLYILPIVILVLEFFRINFKDKRSIFYSIFIAAAIAGVPFFFLKLFFPAAGWQSINTLQISEGINQAYKMLLSGRFDFLFYPFTNLGQLLLPFGAKELESLGWEIIKKSNFLIYGSIVTFIGGIFIYITLGSTIIKSFITALKISSVLIILLRVITKYQGQWFLNNFPNFLWAYIGGLFLLIIFLYIWDSIKKRNINEVLFFLVGFFFLLTFLVPWSYNPLANFGAEGRYMAAPAVGLSLILVRLLVNNFSKSTNLVKFTKISFLVFLMIIQIISVNIYFNQKLSGRSRFLNDKIFNQIKTSIPSLPSDATVFYFENVPHETYEQLLRFGFGYHLHLLYNNKFKDQDFATSAESLEDLIKEKQLRNISNDRVFGFKWENGNLVDISYEIREKLLNFKGQSIWVNQKNTLSK